MLEEYCDSSGKNSTRSDLSNRFELAEKGDWDKLIYDYKQDLLLLPPEFYSQSTRGNMSEQSRFRVICNKVMGGCLRAATRLFRDETATSDTSDAPGSDLEEQARSLFVTEWRGSHPESELSHIFKQLDDTRDG